MPSCTAIPDRVPEDGTLRRTGRRRWPMRLATSTTGRKSRQPATRIGSGPFQAAKPFYCMSRTPGALPPYGRGRFARLVHFGAIKMDIGFGIHLNVSGERTCGMKGAGTDIPFGEWQSASPRTTSHHRSGQKGDNPTGSTDRAVAPATRNRQFVMPNTTPPRSGRRPEGPAASGRWGPVRREGAP